MQLYKLFYFFFIMTKQISNPDDGWFDDDVMATDDLTYDSIVPKDQIQDEIKSLEHLFS